MRKYPSDVSLSKNCIDVNLEMVKIGTQTTFLFPAAGMVRMDNTELALKIKNTVHMKKPACGLK